MIVGIPLDYRRMQFISDAISTFGRFHHWHQDDPLLVRTLADVTFPATTLVPRDVVYREFADFGGSRISWFAPIYIFSADIADILPPDEDPMPFDGNPHPLPGHLQFHNHNWVMPEFPEIGWDELPPPENDHEPHHQEPHMMSHTTFSRRWWMKIKLLWSSRRNPWSCKFQMIQSITCQWMILSLFSNLGLPCSLPCILDRCPRSLGLSCLRTCCGSARFKR